MSLETFEPQRSLSDEEIAVRARYRELMDAWNKGSGEAFAAVFAEHGDLVWLFTDWLWKVFGPKK